MFFFEIQKLIIKFLALIPWDVPQTKLVDLLGTLEFSMFNLELSEVTEVLLAQRLLPQFCDNTLVNAPSSITITIFNLKFSHF
jgi:hypothetical protein